LRIRLLNDDNFLALDNLGFHFLLLGGFQVAILVGLLAHALYCIHHIVLLSEKCIAKICGPLDVV